MDGRRMTPDPLALRIHVVDPEAVPEDLEPRLEALLDEEERARLARFRPLETRRLFRAAHALLRQALSAGRGVPPDAWRFGTAPGGKPFILEPRLPDLPAFSLSHTAGLVVCALAPCEAVGVDAERLDRAARVEALIPRVCSAAEQGLLGPLDADARRRAFLHRWALKEAFLKALGTGLHTNPAEVGFKDAPLGLLHLPEGAGALQDWRCGLLSLTSDHACAWVARTPRPVVPVVRWGFPS